MRQIIMTHPNNLSRLQGQFRTQHQNSRLWFNGMEVRTSTLLPEFAVRWVFPKDPHIIYEESDELWCRFFGFGHEEITTEPAFWVIEEPESAMEATSSFDLPEPVSQVAYLQSMYNSLTRPTIASRHITT